MRKQKTCLALGLYDPVDLSRRVVTKFGPFANDCETKKYLKKIIAEYYKVTESTLCLGVFEVSENARLRKLSSLGLKNESHG